MKSMSPKEINEILGAHFTNLADTLPDPAKYADVFCYRNASDPGTIFYIPLTITPEKGLQEKLQFNLLITGSTNLLQLGCRWDIDHILLKNLDRDLLEKLKPEGLAFINFSVPSPAVKEVRLEMADDSNHFNTLQTANSSGFPPYNALFNLGIDSTQKDRVLHTLNGTNNYMRIRYFVSIPISTTASVALKGTISELSDLENPDLDETSIPGILHKAIQDGIFILSFTGNGGTTIQDQLKQNVLDKAAVALKGYAKSHAEFKNAAQDVVISKGDLTVTATAQSACELSIEPEGSVARWFAGTNTTDYVNISPEVRTSGPVPADNTPSNRGSCIFSAPQGIKDTPVNFIRIATGNESATMSPPDFLPVKLMMQAGGIDVNTSYTDGGNSFDTELPGVTGSEYTLEPGDIGLAVVNFNASSLDAEEATACRVHIAYKPAGNGTDDERTIYLKPGEWSDRWFVCTRDKGLQGELTYEVKVTNKDGSISKYKGVSQEPTIHFVPN
jgi:hypothetical protein